MARKTIKDLELQIRNLQNIIEEKEGAMRLLAEEINELIHGSSKVQPKLPGGQLTQYPTWANYLLDLGFSDDSSGVPWLVKNCKVTETSRYFILHCTKDVQAVFARQLENKNVRVWRGVDITGHTVKWVK